MKKEDLMKYVGSLQQLAYVRSFIYGDGRANGTRAYEVKNDLLSYRVMADKCLDISGLSYKGINFNFLSKPGIQGRAHYDTHGEEAVRSIMGGFFFTAGLENICAPCEVEGTEYPMHGRIRTTPGEHTGCDAFWRGEEYVLQVQAEMREAALFGENLVLRRQIETVFGKKQIIVRDAFENESFRPEPMMLLYHINLGYPFLSEQTKLFIPTKKVTARDEMAAGHESDYDKMDSPKDNEKEYVFIHDLQTEEDGNVRMAVVNQELKLGLMLEYNTKNLPYFMEWKSVASGDYVIGLEPANSSVWGRKYHAEKGDLHTLKPFEKEEVELRFTILDGEEELQEAMKCRC